MIAEARGRLPDVMFRVPVGIGMVVKGRVQSVKNELQLYPHLIVTIISAVKFPLQSVTADPYFIDSAVVPLNELPDDPAVQFPPPDTLKFTVMPFTPCPALSVTVPFTDIEDIFSMGRLIAVPGHDFELLDIGRRAYVTVTRLFTIIVYCKYSDLGYIVGGMFMDAGISSSHVPFTQL